MLFSTYDSNFTQITPHNQNQGGLFNNLWISKGGHFVLAVKKILKGAKVAPGGFGFRTCSSNIINNKTLAMPYFLMDYDHGMVPKKRIDSINR